MDVQRVFHMNGGEGETSYANNSFPQRLVILSTKPFIEEAIQEFISTTEVKRLNIADFGCSSGPNALLAVTMIIDAAHESYRRSDRPCPEFQVFLNDLPQNDFNTILKTIPSFSEKLQEEKGDWFGPCFISATPGSFYGRVFPSENLHFVYSANSLHWLSQVPLELMDDHNKGNICLGKSSPPVVFEAYLAQFRRDFTDFLRSRSQEILPGGCMVLELSGRTIPDPFAEGCYQLLDDLTNALRDLVTEGIVEEEKMDSFNIPFYAPHTEELREVILAEGSFDIIRLDAIPYRVSNLDADESCSMIDQNLRANFMRALTEPLLTSHFGETMIDKLFETFEEKYSQGETDEGVALVISLTRKG